MTGTGPGVFGPNFGRDKAAEHAVAEYQERMRRFAVLHNQMAAVSDVYGNRADIPMPDAMADRKPTVPNLLAQGVDQLAGRIASVMPMAEFAVVKPGVRRSERQASTAGRVIHGWWQTDKVPLKMLRRARHLVAYAITPVVITYNRETKMPTWNIRDPRTCYPDPNLIPGEVSQNAIFAFRRSGDWLIRNGYGDQLRRSLRPGDTLDNNRKVLFMLVESVNEDGRVLALTGHSPNQEDIWNTWSDIPGHVAITLEQSGPNTAFASVPTRLSLDDPSGQFDSMLGMYYLSARLMALEEIAVEKGIFPDTYLVARPGETPRFIDGPHDGRSGKVSIVAGGTIEELNTQPGYQTNPTIDRLERAQRLTGGIPSEFGGESGTNIRTGRRGDAVMSATIDFPVGEAQAILAAGLEIENRAAIRIAKHFDNGSERTVYVGTGNTARAQRYVAEDVFTEDGWHTVTYPVNGADMNSLLIGIGQRVGMGTMSKETAAHLDPLIESPEVEHDRIIAESLETALLAGIQQQASAPPDQGGIPPLVLAKVMSLVKSDRMELAEAMNKVVEDAQKAEAEKQANAQQMQGQPMGTDAAMAPAAAVALTGNPEAASPIPGPTAGQGDLASLLSTLRKPTMTIQPMRGASRGAV